MKYTTQEKMDILNEYFEKDNIIKKSIDGLPRFNSYIDNNVIKDRKFIFEILELDKHDLVRFAIARDGDCTCNSFAMDFNDIWNLHVLIEEYINEVYERENKK